ncbi:MAG: SIS domain-containing protein, partial [Oscillospiraceae bacterium]
MSQLEYLKKITEVINKIGAEQTANIEKAADICAETINSGKLVHLFGSGHSVLPVQDVFPRYGGLVGWHPCMDPR